MRQLGESNKQVVILSEKIDVLLEGINNSFQGLYTVLDNLADKINAEKELTEEEFLRQSISYMQIAIHMVKDVLVLKIEKNHLVEQRFNNIGYDGSHQDGEIFDMIMRFHNDAKMKIKLLRFNNADFKAKLSKKMDNVCKEACEKFCYLFDVREENYNKIELITQVRLHASKLDTLVKCLSIDNIDG
jgi:hypothetical protein